MIKRVFSPLMRLRRALRVIKDTFALGPTIQTNNRVDFQKLLCNYVPKKAMESGSEKLLQATWRAS